MIITGASGGLGKSLRKQFKDAFCPSHKEMDITDKKSVEKSILKFKPDVLIHAAALVGVRECEGNKGKAWNTNVEGTQNIVDALKKLNNNCYLIYMSTACVFAGEHEKYYIEDDVPAPKNYYSFTKACGELVTRQHSNSCIIRTNFVPRKQWKYPKAFVDRYGTYLFSDNVAKGISDVIKKQPKGIIHIVGSRRMSMYDLAILAGSKNIAEQGSSGVTRGKPLVTVGKMTLAEHEGPNLTVDMSMSTNRWKKYKIE